MKLNETLSSLQIAINNLTLAIVSISANKFELKQEVILSTEKGDAVIVHPNGTVIFKPCMTEKKDNIYICQIYSPQAQSGKLCQACNGSGSVQVNSKSSGNSNIPDLHLT